jgi:hypothetical protein
VACEYCWSMEVRERSTKNSCTEDPERWVKELEYIDTPGHESMEMSERGDAGYVDLFSELDIECYVDRTRVQMWTGTYFPIIRAYIEDQTQSPLSTPQSTPVVKKCRASRGLTETDIRLRVIQPFNYRWLLIIRNADLGTISRVPAKRQEAENS